MFTTLKALFAGIVIGILVAPDKGSKTRTKLANMIAEYKDEAMDFIKEAAEKAESKIHAAKDAVADL